MCQIAVEWPFDHLLPSQMRKVASLSAQPLRRNSYSRTSENSVEAKFAECTFHALRCINPSSTSQSSTPDYDGTRIDQIARAPSVELFWSPSGANARSRTKGQAKNVLSHDVPSPSPCHHVHNTQPTRSEEDQRWPRSVCVT